jgi:hypothetical protein
VRGRAGRNVLMALWVLGIAGFAGLHAVHLRADFPNHSPWMFDWAKYTDEGWYGDAALRAHLFGNWYMAGDFNPAVAVPVWPLVEWVLFCITGVTVQAARALAVAVFFVNLALSYTLLRAGGAGLRGEERAARTGAQQGLKPGSRGAALLAVSLLVTSPFLYCFSRLAILEPLLMTWVLAALNVAVRLPNMRRKGMRRPVWGAVGVGALAVLAALTKTTAIFLLPALAWAVAASLWKTRRLAIACVATAGATFAAGYGLWVALIVRLHLLDDYRYYFFVNDYARPTEWYWPVVSLWWSMHGLLWADKVLAPLAGVMVLGAAGAWGYSALRRARTSGPSAAAVRNGGRPQLRMTEREEMAAGEVHWARKLLLDPVVGTSVLGIAGMVLFMTYQNHPQPRYFAPVAFFLVFIVAMGLEAGFDALGIEAPGIEVLPARARASGVWLRAAAGVAAGVTVLAMCANGAQTISYATHPEYTFVTAAANLTHYIDTHPNGKRLLVSISGDEITLLTHLPSLCDDFGTMDLPEKIGAYQPGWYAAWNDLDPGTLEDLHTHFSVEQVVAFPAFDDPERNELVLFKLHALPNGEVRDPYDSDKPDLTQPLPEDSIQVPME